MSVCRKTYFQDSANTRIQPYSYDTIIVENGSFFITHPHIEFVFDRYFNIIPEASGDRFRKYSPDTRVHIQPKKEILLNKHLLFLNLSPHYWHFHHETLSQIIMYQEHGIFEQYTPETSCIYINTRAKFCDFAKEAIQLLFNKNFLDYELIYPEFDTLYRTSKNAVTTTKTSVAGVLPTLFTAKYIANKINHTDEPTKYLFIGRDDCDHRKCLNQKELIDFLNENGYPFVNCVMTGMPYLQQVELFKSAKKIIMITGSGSTNQLYCNTEKCHIIYICPKDGLPNCSVIGSQQTGIVHNTLYGYENVAPDVSEELKLKCKKYTSRENFDFYIDKHALLALVKNV
jgi:capsular polysaccharide biosynthesis protein